MPRSGSSASRPGFMRNQTQERIEELARERAAAAIDLALVEDGIEIGKKMMAEMIANYPSQGKSPASRRRAAASRSAAPRHPTAATATSTRWPLRPAA